MDFQLRIFLKKLYTKYEAKTDHQTDCGYLGIENEHRVRSFWLFKGSHAGFDTSVVYKCLRVCHKFLETKCRLRLFCAFAEMVTARSIH